MEQYQFGKHLTLERVLENKEYYANLFAEGNADLKKLLLYCFDNNIESYMCCVGHHEEDAAFIMLNIPYNNKELIYSIVSSVYNVEDAIIRLGKKYERNLIEVDVRSYYGTDFFKNVYKGITDLSNAKRVKPEIVNIVEVLNQFNHPPYDLYFKSSCWNERTQYETWVDYVYAIDDKRSRFLYVLDKNVPSSNIEQYFDKDALDACTKKIKREIH